MCLLVCFPMSMNSLMLHLHYPSSQGDMATVQLPPKTTPIIQMCHLQHRAQDQTWGQKHHNTANVSMQM